MLWKQLLAAATAVVASAAFLGLVVGQETPSATNTVEVAVILDTGNLEWAKDVLDVTTQLLKEGQWLKSVIPSLSATGIDDTTFSFSLRNTACDQTTAVREYWDERDIHGVPPHAIIGAYCSGASISLARVAGLEKVPVLSPFSTSSQLSDTAEFPYFSRIVAPDDFRGGVMAMVATLRQLGWARVSLLATDVQYAQDWSTEFRRLWEGEGHGDVSYSNTIRVGFDGKAVEESILQALNEMPTDQPEINSRIVVLAAHAHHAYPVLQKAAEINFQPDTVWAGTSGWIGANLKGMDTSWMAYQPGLIGVRPHQGEDRSVHKSFLGVFQENLGWKSLPNFVPQLIDAILTASMTFASLRQDQYSDGDAVTKKLRDVSFDGVSSKIEFNDLGDLKNPQYSITQLQRVRGDLQWVTVGISGNSVGSASFSGRLCFPGQGCNDPKEAPSDRYPVPHDKLPIGVVVAISIVVLLLLLVGFKYWRSRRSKRNLKKELQAFQDSIVGMRTASVDYIPTVLGDRNRTSSNNSSSLSSSDVEQALPHSHETLTIKPQCKVIWCWQETPNYMSKHDDESIEGDRATSTWIKYKNDCNSALEAAYQRGDKSYCPLPEYSVDFQSMTQTKLSTDFKRSVKRVVIDPATRASMELKDKTVSFDAIRMGVTLPRDIRYEPQMCLVKGDVVQISKQRQDGWVFGTKLHHEDEVVARNFVLVATKDIADNEEANVFADTGWFPLDATEIPSSDDLTNLQKSVGGDAAALEAPKYWDPVKDPTCVQNHRLKQEDPEYQKVKAAFLSTLKNRKVKVTKIERIQNLAMWQSYVVKRQTICIRETSRNKSKQPSDKTEASKLKRVIDRFERSWLWHGTNTETLPKILQQGFNRSFCGKNATMYGKGVYFARDASYSSYKTYAVPDASGKQYVLACKVCVGEYCVGIKDSLTPSIRDPRTQSLYDSTVNEMNNPSIYVTYHDAQAYPEYLIQFKQE